MHNIIANKRVKKFCNNVSPILFLKINYFRVKIGKKNNKFFSEPNRSSILISCRRLKLIENSRIFGKHDFKLLANVVQSLSNTEYVIIKRNRQVGVSVQYSNLPSCIQETGVQRDPILQLTNIMRGIQSRSIN